MSAREVILLGTASQVPTRQRNHNALFLRWTTSASSSTPARGRSARWPTRGWRRRRSRTSASRTSTATHCLGLAALVQRISLDRVPHPIEVFFPESGQIYFERLRHASSFMTWRRSCRGPSAASGRGGAAGGACRRRRLWRARWSTAWTATDTACGERDGRRHAAGALQAEGCAARASASWWPAAPSRSTGARCAWRRSASRGRAALRPADGHAPCAGARALAEAADLLVCESTYLTSEAAEAYDHYHMTAAQAGELGRAAGCGAWC